MRQSVLYTFRWSILYIYAGNVVSRNQINVGAADKYELNFVNLFV